MLEWLETDMDYAWNEGATEGRAKKSAWKLHTNSFKIIIIIFYCLCYYSCPKFSPFDALPALLQAVPALLSMSVGHAYIFFSYSILCAVLYIPMSIL